MDSSTLQKEDPGLHSGSQELAKQTILPLQLALANALLEKGEIHRSAAYLKQLNEQTLEKTQPAIFVQKLELEGKLNLFSGKFGPALICFHEVLSLCVQRGFVPASVAGHAQPRTCPNFIESDP